MEIKIDAEKNLLNHLAYSFGLPKYVWLMDNVHSIDIAALNEKGCNDFQKTFNSFYRVRRNGKWRKVYYDYFEAAKNGNPDFKDILIFIKDNTPQHNLEPSFSSKMLATIDPDKPIWDSRVLKRLELERDWHKNPSVQNAISIYDTICERYRDYLAKSEADKAIAIFDKYLQKYKGISNVKKIDFLLWSMGDTYQSDK